MLLGHSDLPSNQVKRVFAFILHDKQRVNSLEAGLEVKYLIMLLCIKGIRQQQRTTAFTAIMPKATAWREKAHVNREKRHEIKC